MAKPKKSKADSPPKKKVKKRANPKPAPDDEKQEVFATVHWETTDQGQLAVWQIPDDDDETASLSILPGAISDAKYDKTWVGYGD